MSLISPGVNLIEMGGAQRSFLRVNEPKNTVYASPKRVSRQKPASVERVIIHYPGLCNALLITNQSRVQEV